jgi:hypothetical protein
MKASTPQRSRVGTGEVYHRQKMVAIETAIVEKTKPTINVHP